MALAIPVAATAPLLGGCGIQETDVIEAGGPASVQAFFNRDTDMLLFFRTPDGRLTPVIRTPEPETEFGPGLAESGSGAENNDAAAGPIPTEKVILALLHGPRPEDQAAGLTTALPTAGLGPTVEIDVSPDGKVTARLPLAVKGLNSIALRQLTCTIAYSKDTDGEAVVQLTGRDGASRSGTCGLAPGSAGGTAGEAGTRAGITPLPGASG
ncbi:hypothetical protein [Streptomyces sp. HD]|uniref:hypothetical protein n=1 Tax=Streptomyces sp. HD TaxID=3020892 RepID=UPI00232E25CF|nr:hypothetical protein [Streptomyces sp. HD]MDC0769579.1 hypothetical protein [Streptomyces sp. HD]